MKHSGIGGIDVTSLMGTSTITTPSVPTQGSRDPSETRRHGGVHFEESDRDKDKGGGAKHRTRRYEIEICRPPYCKGNKLEFRTMSRYARERKVDHNTDSLVVKTFLDQLRIVGLGFGD